MKKSNKKWKLAELILIMAILVLLAGCNKNNSDIISQNPPENNSVEETKDEIVLKVTGEGIDKSYTLDDLKALQNGEYEHIYSTINNWPLEKNYAAKGIKIESILNDVKAMEEANIITFKSDDGYETVLTREQLIGMKQYYFEKDESGQVLSSQEVKPIIAYEYKKGSKDINEIKEESLCLIIGQTNANEHTNPAFVENVCQINISSKKPSKWNMAETFPKIKNIALGESVKLQHKDFGKVKLFYTLDGTDPTEMSTMYNPSTYQPELNKPIPIYKDTVIKVLVTGYGKENSDIATFDFKVK